MTCPCGSSECTCQSRCICTQAGCVCIACHMIGDHRCQLCGLTPFHQSSPEQTFEWCECFLSESIMSSGPNRTVPHIENNTASTSSNRNIQDNELPLAIVPLGSSQTNVEFGSTLDQFCNTVTSEPSNILNIPDWQEPENQAEQMYYLPIIPLEQTQLVTEQTEQQNPTEFSSHHSFPTHPANSSSRVQYFVSVLNSNRANRSSGTSNLQFQSNRTGRTLHAANSRYATGAVQRNTSFTPVTRISNLRAVRPVSRDPQVSTGTVLSGQSLSTLPFSNYYHDPSFYVPSMLGPPVFMRQEFVPPPPANYPFVRPPFYTDSATQMLQTRIPSSVQNRPRTRRAFSVPVNNRPVMQYRSSRYSRLHIFNPPRLCGEIIQPMQRVMDWLNSMTPDFADQETCSGSPVSSLSPTSVKELSESESELPNRIKSDKNTDKLSLQSGVIASSNECSYSPTDIETTADPGATFTIATSTADLENENFERIKSFNESKKEAEATADTHANIETTLQESSNIEGTDDTDSSNNS